ncbi:MAG: hypothetical protein JSS49_22845 [Planctomycetes bacterium]|nr:hypothetical protein [Planctomycetota bacterium]
MKSQVLIGVILVAWFAWAPVRAADLDRADDDFVTANRVATASMKTVLEAKSELDDAIRIRVCQQEVIDSLKAVFTDKLNNAAPKLERALSLVTDADDKQEVRRARLHSAYANFWLRKNFEAAVLAADVARNADASDGTLALDCTFLTFAALVQAFHQSPVRQREDLQLIINACNKLTDRWPTSDRAIESVMILGNLHSAEQLPADAAIWFGKVAPSHPKYPEAQINAGQAYWNAYVKASRVAAPQKPEPAQFSAWLLAAHGHLRSGIDAMTKRVPDNAMPPELFVAKMLLSQIAVSQGQDAEALKLLTDEPFSLMTAIAIPDGTDRPDHGIQSRRCVLECHVLKYRAHIGLGQIQLADETLEELTDIFGESTVTDVLSQLEIQMQQLRENGELESYQRMKKSVEQLQMKLAPTEN